ncbi:ImmA/IrrE family metallo-endopeptidase [Desulfovibrio sp. JC010]|uniref:ImmA/IrrE family metallo-endopeptidase n=1 Tax=Desulfovibrio sp. JC010 TaxID=2593641 RepID=UPI0013D56AD0|nr:ImmA/IrrE family metallo-endopeptidase [Desulfovibrio sp. JC010]NDV28434.1 ImmA/IrrE family metallo-endopeptidase [Desulfovibrio sp. JC010]
MPIQSAKTILKEYWDGRLPVDPARIATGLGVRVEKSFGEITNNAGQPLSGEFTLENGEPVIKYNVTEAAVRQRFTVAHELGHYVLQHGPRHRDEAQNFSINNYDLYEVAANNFAAELLMPSEAVSYLLSQGKNTLQSLADSFNVSTVAMNIRLKKLGIY